MSSHRRDFLRVASGLSASTAVLLWAHSVDSSENWCESDFIVTNLQRKFSLPHPLYEANSAWRQSTASAGLKEPQSEYIHEMFCLLKGHRQNFCNLNSDDFTIPIFEATPSSESDVPLDLKTYDGESWQTSTLRCQQVETGGRFAVKGIPRPAGVIRPSGPKCRDADGHMVLVDTVKALEYNFWAATTLVDDQKNSLGGGFEANAIQFAGAIERFSLRGPGAQTPDPDCRVRNSARATGVPLLAGLLVPEDFQNGGEMTHAMAFAIPRLRHIHPATNESPRDYVYPATKSETSHYTASPWAMGAGERIRLRETIIDQDGNAIKECDLSPAAQRYVKALRTYGAYLVDGSGAFSFYAEDCRTGNLNLGLDEFNTLCRRPVSEALPEEKSQWQVLVETLYEDFRAIPFAVRKEGRLVSNFDFITDAVPPAGFEPVCGPAKINAP